MGNRAGRWLDLRVAWADAALAKGTGSCRDAMISTMEPKPTARIGSYQLGGDQPLALIAGPCVIESAEHSLRLAERIANIARKLELPYIFKASYDKANRSSLDSFRGPGLEAGLRILGQVRAKVGVPVLSDIHEPAQAAPAGEVLDVLQVPAFLCRQTDLLLACGRAGKCVNIKKGQFLAAEKMQLAVDKVRSTGNPNVLVTDRGTFFGYERLINDFTGFEVMRRFAPVVFDATHSVQYPGGVGNVTGGARQFIPLLARAAIAAGIDALFLEVHDDPDHAKSDSATVWPLEHLEHLLAQCLRIRKALRA
jgi:2-dehydro-3-deoxyphosphooctonate aldolase (KDO 8-P synthase)